MLRNIENAMAKSITVSQNGNNIAYSIQINAPEYIEEGGLSS